MLDRRNDEMKSNVVRIRPAITKDFVLKVVNGIIDTLKRYKGSYVKNLSTLSENQTWKVFFDEGGKIFYSTNIQDLKDKIDSLNNLYIPVSFQQIRIEINKIIDCFKDIYPLVSSEDLRKIQSELYGDFVFWDDIYGGNPKSKYLKSQILNYQGPSYFPVGVEKLEYFGNFTKNNIIIKKDNIHIGIAIKSNLNWFINLDSRLSQYFYLDYSKGCGNDLIFLIRKDSTVVVPEGLTGTINLQKKGTSEILSVLNYTITNESQPDDPYLEIQGADKQGDTYIILLNKIILRKIIKIMANTDWNLEVQNLTTFNKFFTLDKYSGSGDSTINISKGQSVDIVDKSITTYNAQTFDGKVVAGTLQENVQFIFDDVLLQLGQTSFIFNSNETSVPISKTTSIFTNASDIKPQIPSGLNGYVEASIVNGVLTIKKIKNSTSTLTGDINLINSANQIYFSIPCTLSAQEIPNYVISVLVNPTGAGRASGGGTYQSGTRISLSATANDGYVFKDWNDGNNQNPRSITVTKNETYTANFDVKLPDKYVITVIADPVEGGTVEGGGSFDENSQITIVATANTGYSFLGWWYNDNKVSSETSYKLTVKTDATYTAKFSKNSYTVTLELDSSNPNRGSLSGGGTYEYNTEVTAKCVLTNEDDVFGGWFKNNTKVSSNLSYKFNVTENITLRALIYFIDVEPNSLSFEAEGGTKSFNVTSNIDGWTIS